MFYQCFLYHAKWETYNLTTFTQLPFLKEDLPNDTILIQASQLRSYIPTSIFYAFELGTPRLEYLLKPDGFNLKTANQDISVKIFHIGNIKLSNAVTLNKLGIEYNYVKKLENAFDYETKTTKISKVLIKNKISAYSYNNNLYINSAQKNVNAIVNCIREYILTEKASTGRIRQNEKRQILKSNDINLKSFMTYLVNKQNGIVKAISIGDLPQKENESVVIYGDEANTSIFYENLQKMSNTVKCITVKLSLSGTTSNVLFNKTNGVMIYGNYAEERALKLMLEAYNLIWDYIINGE